ncbi:MAG: EF-hand domain-containing protein [Candidatus Sericytochromatia bacterium]|nr:EF-hand domain-containing protein [Candidatus Sericytochromatia bacterium]
MRMNVVSTAILAGALLVGCDMQLPLPLSSPAPTASGSTGSSAAAKDFVRYDTDRNGSLNQTEFVAGQWGDIRFIKAPTEAEVATFKAGLAKDFKELDTDRNGSLNQSEYAASLKYR